MFWSQTMNNKLKRLELIQSRESMIELLWEIHLLKNNLFDQGIIDRDGFKKISRREAQIKYLIDDLTVRIFESILTDIEEPRKKIMAATVKINNAIQELQEINKFLHGLDLFINLLSTVVLSVSTGNPALIARILDQIISL